MKNILIRDKELMKQSETECGFNPDKFAELVRADEREAIAKMCEEHARKWWKIHCDSNLHYSSTLKAHQDFCAFQAAIRARGDK